MARYLIILIALLGSLITCGCQQPILSADDTIMMGEIKSPIRIYATRKGLMEIGRRIPDVEVVIYADDKEIGQGKTNKSGFLDADAYLSKETESFTAKAIIGGEEYQSKGIVYHWPERTVVVVDVDETISQTDFNALLSGEDRDVHSKPLPGAVATLNQIVKDFNVFYLTARPREVLDKTRLWIKEQGFPEAPIVTADSLGDVMDQQKYKREAIQDIQKLVPNLLIGIGDKETDSQAYGRCGLLAIIIARGDTKGFRAHAFVQRDWESVGKFFQANRKVLQDPQKLKQAMAEKGMLQKPIIAWQEGK